jgi:flagellar P-ring protein precursor FlgI
MTVKQTIFQFAFISVLVLGSSCWSVAQQLSNQPDRPGYGRRLVNQARPLSSQRQVTRLVPIQRVELAQGLAPVQPRPHLASAPIDPAAFSIRIKDITSIEGHRVNYLTGIGLVTGLKGTGGKSPLTQDLASNMLRNFGVLTQTVPTGSMAAVTVKAEIPPFARAGEPVRATISLMDDATSLYGGGLEQTPLKGYDNQVYAIAGGPLIVGGFTAGGDGAAITKNHDVAAKVEAILEVPIDQGAAFPNSSFRLLLRNKDYATAYRIATAINKIFPGHARALDQGSVNVVFPQSYRQSKIDFVVLINDMRVTPDAPARVVINQKSGTIVVGQNVRLSKIMFAVGNLIVATTESPIVSQPAPLSQGQTVVVPRTGINVTETGGRYNLINQQTTVGELATALNTLGVTPQDLISVFQTIEQSGALQATLVIQ